MSYKHIDFCRSCRAPMVWLPTVSGSRMPVNADTVNPGDRQFNAARGHISHFATCPKAKEHRGNKR